MGQDQAKPLTPEQQKEQIRQQKRYLERAERKIKSEAEKLKRTEAKTLKEIKTLAQNNRHDAAKIMSKSLVQQRSTYNQYIMMSSQIKSMVMQISSM